MAAFAVTRNGGGGAAAAAAIASPKRGGKPNKQQQRPLFFVALLVGLSLLCAFVATLTTKKAMTALGSGSGRSDGANNPYEANYRDENSLLMDLVFIRNTENKADDNGKGVSKAAATKRGVQRQPPSPPHREDAPELRTTDNNNANLRQVVQFVFIMGIEGVGHNLMKEIVKGSPTVAKLQELGLMNDVTALQDALHRPKNGLMNMHCGFVADKQLNPDTGLPDVATKFDKIVSRLREISDKIIDSSSTTNADDGTTSVATVPLNVLTHEMASYPQDSDDCRPLKYPNLDYVYEACSRAGVVCRHLYLYRDPYAVLRSTTRNRGFETSGLKAAHLYTTMLKVLYAQLATHPGGTAGCFGFYDDDNVITEDMSYWNTIRDMFGWHRDDGGNRQQSDFAEYVRSKYKPPKPMSHEDKADVVPDDYRLYMQSWTRIDDRVRQLCRRQFDANTSSNKHKT